MDFLNTIWADHVWHDKELRLVICKETPSGLPNIPFRQMAHANYVIFVDVARFKVAKNRTGSMSGIANLLTDHLGVEFVVDGDYLTLADEEDLSILRLKGVI